MRTKQEVQKELVAAKTELDNFEMDVDKYESQYEDCLDETSDPIKICGISFQPSRVLAELDPTAFRCGLLDYVDSLNKEDDDDYKELAEKAEELENELEDIEAEEIEKE